METSRDLFEAIADRVQSMRNPDGSPNWAAIAADLNGNGITTAKGKPWTANNLAMFYSRNKDKYQISGREIPTSDTTIIPPTETYLPPDNQDAEVVTTVDDITTENTTNMVTNELVERLTAMLEWYEGRKPTETPERVDYRPKFVGPVRSLGLKISSPVHAAALARAKKETHIVGKSFNALVEYLLWEYAGKSTELIATGKNEHSGE